MRGLWLIGCAVACGDRDRTAIETSAPATAAVLDAATEPRIVDASGPDASPRPLELTWSANPPTPGEWKLTLAGGEFGHAYGNEFRLRVYLSTLPVGTEYKIGGTRGVVTSDDASRDVTVEVLRRLAAVKWANRRRVDLGLTLELSLPDGRTGSTAIPAVSFETSWQSGLNVIAQKGLIFGDETIEDHRSDGLVYASDDGLKLLGSARTFADVDFVAANGRTADETGRKTCRGYTDNQGKRVADITLVLRGVDVNVWDRRTGQLVETHAFPPDPTCPFVGLATGDNREVISSTPTAAIERWLKSRVKR